MPYEQRDNEATLFCNEKMREGKSDPQYTGSGMVNGVEVWLSAWVNTSKKDGKKFFGIKFKPKQASGNKTNPVASQPEIRTPDDDDVPF